MDAPAIFVIAAPAARRSALKKSLSGIWPRARILADGTLSPERLEQSRAEILLGDLESQAQAERFLSSIFAGVSLPGAVALVDDPNPAWVRRALAAGVRAFIARDSPSEDLRLAIEAAYAGFVLLHPSSARQLFAPAQISLEPELEPENDGKLIEHLTARERQVLRLMGSGLGNRDIAARLGISEHTVKFHASSILGKLGASSRTEAVSQGIRRGLIFI
jgi:DNA-binding NarL/FixJ family response regulator